MISSRRRSSSMKISSGISWAMGATPPMAKPVARLTVSASARRAGPPASIVSLPSSTRLAPEAITRTGRSWTLKTSDWAMPPSPPGDLGVRQRRRRRRLLAGEVEVLDALGGALVPVAAHEVVVEVAPARPHAAHVEGEARLDHGPAGGDVVAQHDGDGGRDVEAREGFAAARAREARLARFLDD